MCWITCEGHFPPKMWENNTLNQHSITCVRGFVGKRRHWENTGVYDGKYRFFPLGRIGVAWNCCWKHVVFHLDSGHEFSCVVRPCWCQNRAEFGPKMLENEPQNEPEMTPNQQLVKQCSQQAPKYQFASPKGSPRDPFWAPWVPQMTQIQHLWAPKAIQRPPFCGPWCPKVSSRGHLDAPGIYLGGS